MQKLCAVRLAAGSSLVWRCDGAAASAWYCRRPLSYRISFMLKLLAALAIAFSATGRAAALTLPPFEIVPFGHIATPTIGYTAFKIDRINNQISFCTVSQSQPSGVFSGNCFRKINVQLKASVAGTSPYVPGVLTQELWLIDLDSGAVQLCIFAPVQECIAVPDL
jgi:hypothetical protein